MPFRIVEVQPDGRTVNHDHLGIFDTGAAAAAVPTHPCRYAPNGVCLT